MLACWLLVVGMEFVDSPDAGLALLAICLSKVAVWATAIVATVIWATVLAWRRHFLGAGLVALLMILPASYWSLAGNRPSVSAQTLVEASSPGPSWTAVEFNPAVLAPIGDPEQAHANWTQVDRQPIVSVDVYAFGFPGSAKLHFWLDQPSHSMIGEWPHITEDDGSELQFAPDADDDKTACGIGDHNGCSVWHLWLRYGQYCVLIRYFAPDHAISDSELRELSTPTVSAIEDQLT